MKKLNLLCIAFALVLTACSSDDDGGTPANTSGDLLGTWIGVDVDYTGNSTTSAQGQTLESTFVGEAYDVDYMLTFTENPNEVVADGSYSIELTTTTLGQSQVDNIENLEFINDGTWSRVGDQLTIVNGEATSVGTIVELTDTMLRLAISQTDTQTQPDFEFTSTVNAVMTYTKM